MCILPCTASTSEVAILKDLLAALEIDAYPDIGCIPRQQPPYLSPTSYTENSTIRTISFTSRTPDPKARGGKPPIMTSTSLETSSLTSSFSPCTPRPTPPSPSPSNLKCTPLHRIPSEPQPNCLAQKGTSSKPVHKPLASREVYRQAHNTPAWGKIQVTGSPRHYLL